MYPYMNVPPPPLKGLGPGFPHTQHPPTNFPPGGNKLGGGGHFLQQGPHRAGNKGVGPFFQMGNNQMRNNAHHKPNVSDRHIEYLFGFVLYFLRIL